MQIVRGLGSPVALNSTLTSPLQIPSGSVLKSVTAVVPFDVAPMMLKVN